jgi:hypothetical protein
VGDQYEGLRFALNVLRDRIEALERGDFARVKPLESAPEKSQMPQDERKVISGPNPSNQERNTAHGNV